MKPGQRTTILITQELYDDLTVIMSAGVNFSTAIRLAARHVADTYRHAWECGDYPGGMAPRVRADAYHPHNAEVDVPEDAYDATEAARRIHRLVRQRDDARDIAAALEAQNARALEILDRPLAPPLCSSLLDIAVEAQTALRGDL